MSLLSVVSPAARASDLALETETEAQSVTSRRDREANAGSVMVRDSLGQKVLHGWLQNRHQTLMPLTLNMRILTDRQRAVIGQALAALLLAGRPRSDAEAEYRAMHLWLDTLGADQACIDAFDEATRVTPSLDQVMEHALGESVAVYVYVAALTASDPRYPATRLLADVLQARFDLPATVVRTVIRRHRR